MGTRYGRLLTIAILSAGSLALGAGCRRSPDYGNTGGVSNRSPSSIRSSRTGAKDTDRTLPSDRSTGSTGAIGAPAGGTGNGTGEPGDLGGPSGGSSMGSGSSGATGGTSTTGGTSGSTTGSSGNQVPDHTGGQ